MSAWYHENEAKEKYCWLTLARDNGWRNCIANSCMGWRWANESKRIGYCCKGGGD